MMKFKIWEERKTCGMEQTISIYVENNFYNCTFTCTVVDG